MYHNDSLPASLPPWTLFQPPNMTLWVVRTGKHGEHEQRFLTDDRIYLTWDGFNHDLSKVSDPGALIPLLLEVYPDATSGRTKNHATQLWTFAKKMAPGDWVVVPSKKKPAVHIAEIRSDYAFDKNAEDPYFHSRKIKWMAIDVPRIIFDPDLLYSFGAIQTIFSVSRNDAEQRVRNMAKAGWLESSPLSSSPVGDDSEEEVELESVARDQIAKLILKKYKGHGMERLVGAVLEAQGYTTYQSPVGADKGVDLLAAPGALGFGHPRICVQVKSGAGPVDAPTVNQLIGTMQNVHAEQGLFVSWGGFKSSVDKETPGQFFRVRFWDQQMLIDQLLANYDKLDPDLRAELPLKQIWVVSKTEFE